MTIGPITSTSSLLAALGTQQSVSGSGGVSESEPGLFTALLKSELDAVASVLESTGSPGAPNRAAVTPAAEPSVLQFGEAAPAMTAGAAAAATDAGGSPATSTAATAPSAATLSPAPSGSSSAPAAPSSAATSASSGGRRYVVTYAAGVTPVSTGPTPAPLVKGPTGQLVLTAKTTGLSQLTPRFTGTVANPTAAAMATATTMAAIAYLKAHGQA